MRPYCRQMKQIKQLTLLLLFWVIGELIVKSAGLPIPGSIIGMLLLVIALRLKIIRINQVEEVAHFLIDNMALFFIPAGVGLMCYLDIIKSEWQPIVMAIVISTLLVMAVVAFISKSNRQNHE